jgi:hypothetical protein
MNICLGFPDNRVKFYRLMQEVVLAKTTRASFEDKMAALHQASIQLIQDVSIESLLERIAAQASQLGDVKYAALGILSDTGRLERFIPIGLTAAELAGMDHQPLAWD